MHEVEFFCTPFCPYCTRAKRLLDSKNINYKEIRVDQEPERHHEMIKRSKRTSVPQIFIDDYHVGGCDELFVLEAEGKLDSRLGL
jgi:glutaredoxin 3